MSAIKLHSFLSFGDGAVGIFHGADSPAAFVMLRCLKLSLGGAQMLQRATHVRLIGAGC